MTTTDPLWLPIFKSQRAQYKIKLAECEQHLRLMPVYEAEIRVLKENISLIEKDIEALEAK